MAKLNTRVQNIVAVAEGTIRVIFDKPDGFTFEAGQSIDLSIPDMTETDIKGNLRAFSIASAPTDPALEITTRVRDSIFKKTLRSMSPGAALEFEGPFGSFTLHENSARGAVMLVGGIGITPFRSMIRDAVARSLPHSIYLFYSNRRPEDAAFLDELMEIGNAENNVTVVPTMSEMGRSEREWNGEKGYITYPLVQKFVPAGANPVYYMAGPQGMVLAMQKMLTENGISKDDIKFEEFTGY